MTKILVTGVLLVAGGLALAKLPPPDDATKAKAAETAAKAAWQAKMDGYQLCKAQDKVVARYRATAKVVPTSTAAAAPANPAPTAAAPQAAASGTPSAAAPQAAASGTPTAAAPQAAASGTPVAATPLAPCMEPPPFAYNPPEQKPLEASGAHSPTGTAANPPSVKSNSAEMAPAKK